MGNHKGRNIWFWCQNTQVCAQVLCLIYSEADIAGWFPNICFFLLPSVVLGTLNFFLGTYPPGIKIRLPSLLCNFKKGDMCLFCPFVFPNARNAAISLLPQYHLGQWDGNEIYKGWRKKRGHFHPELSNSWLLSCFRLCSLQVNPDLNDVSSPKNVHWGWFRFHQPNRIAMRFQWSKWRERGWKAAKYSQDVMQI